MKITCGLFIISNNKLLIVHPTGHKNDSWSIPKGIFDETIDKNHFDAAIRETFEETNLKFDILKGKIKDLGIEKYEKRNKSLHGYLYIPFNDVTNELLKCNSFCELYKKQIPEVDNFKWVDINSEYIEFLHDTQKKLFKKINL
jgi:predicted NUDIX family NTP pyrophosphohydrolase